MHETVKMSNANVERIHVEVRTGIHSGNIVAAIVGSVKPKFCVFGETVQVARSLETTSKETVSLHCSVDTKLLVESSSEGFQFTDAGQTKHNNLELLTFYLSTAIDKVVS